MEVHATGCKRAEKTKSEDARVRDARRQVTEGSK